MIKPMKVFIDDNLKNDADILFGKLGLSTNDAIKIFLSQSVREQKIPFRIKLESSESDSSKITIELSFNENIRGLAGRELGLKTFNEQLKEKILLNDTSILIKFPDNIELVSSSFMEGLFSEILKNKGYKYVEKYFKVKTSSEHLNYDLMSKVI